VTEEEQANHAVEIAQAQELAQELKQNLIRQRGDFESIYAHDLRKPGRHFPGATRVADHMNALRLP